MIKQYVEFFYPGSFVSTTSELEVADRKPLREIPDGAYGYRFFARIEVVEEGETLVGKNKDYSPMTYYGEALTLKDIKAMKPPGDYSILVLNMEGNKWGRVVRTIHGSFRPLSDGDVVLPLNSL